MARNASVNLRITFPTSVEAVALNFNIIHAAYYGDLDAIKSAVREYSEAVHLTHEASGSTALHLAAGYGYYDIVEFLINCRGVNFHALDHKGRTAFDRAAMISHMGIMDLLWDAMWPQNNGPPNPPDFGPKK